MVYISAVGSAYKQNSLYVGSISTLFEPLSRQTLRRQGSSSLAKFGESDGERVWITPRGRCGKPNHKPSQDHPQ